MIPIQKKANAIECGDHRTISLISHASKIVLKILNKRIEARAKSFIGKNQFGFRTGYGTRDAIGVMRTLCERSLEHDNDVYICFVDFEKAFIIIIIINVYRLFFPCKHGSDVSPKIFLFHNCLSWASLRSSLNLSCR